MLGRKRGGAADKSRKMAKKGAALQTEVNNDEEWEKILQRQGLVLVDIYSEWSGPCAGMVSVLKKIKMEMGGDDLSYAVAKCDHISSLSRFRGRSEPIWMFLRNGFTVNIAFGANCPELTQLLTEEIARVQKDEPPEFSVPVDEVSEKEAVRMAAVMEEKNKKEAAANAKREAEAKRRYEAYIEHLRMSLSTETCLIMFPWCFKDEDGNKRDKKSSPPYTEFLELVNSKFAIETEVRRTLEEEDIEALQKETEYKLAEETKQLLLDGFCFVFRLRLLDSRAFEDPDSYLINLLYGETEVPEIPYALIEGCFVQRHLPPQYAVTGDTESAASVFEGGEMESNDKVLLLSTVWVPLNVRNRVIAFRTLFQKYVESNYPYEDADAEFPIMLFKYDSTKKNELQSVYNSYSSEVINFGVFERDKTPDPVMIADSIQAYDKKETLERTGYEVFVVVVKKVNNEAFLSFAGLGPYHVSENPEIAIEEAKVYFPPENPQDENENEEEEDDKEEDTPAENV